MGYRRLQCPSRHRTASIIPYFIFGDPLFRILSFASLTIDIIENKRVPGGPALYYSLASRFLETNLYCIGFKPRGYVWYEPKGIFFVGDGPVFRHVYSGDERLSWIVSKPGKVEFKTILGMNRVWYILNTFKKHGLIKITKRGYSYLSDSDLIEVV